MSFFDHPSSQPAVSPIAELPTSDAAAVLYATAPEVKDTTATAEVQAARDADVGRALYATDTMFKDTGLDKVEGLDHVAAAEVLRDMGAGPADARQLSELVQALPNVTARDIDSWITETSRIDPADMQLARDYLKTDPRTLAFIERHPDLAVHPETVRRVISLAKAARLKGSK